MAKKEDGNELTKALGFKSKVMDLIQAASEVHNYLKVAVDDTQSIASMRNDVHVETESLKREKLAVEKALHDSRKAYETEKRNQEEERAKASQVLAEMYESAKKDREEATRIKADLEKRESNLSRQEAAFETKRRDLEARHAKIAALAGGVE